jgi:hypothetical protein
VCTNKPLICLLVHGYVKRRGELLVRNSCRPCYWLSRFVNLKVGEHIVLHLSPKNSERFLHLKVWIFVNTATWIQCHLCANSAKYCLVSADSEITDLWQSAINYWLNLFRRTYIKYYVKVIGLRNSPTWHSANKARWAFKFWKWIQNTLLLTLGYLLTRHSILFLTNDSKTNKRDGNKRASQEQVLARCHDACYATRFLLPSSNSVSIDNRVAPQKTVLFGQLIQVLLAQLIKKSHASHSFKCKIIKVFKVPQLFPVTNYMIRSTIIPNIPSRYTVVLSSHTCVGVVQGLLPLRVSGCNFLHVSRL